MKKVETTTTNGYAYKEIIDANVLVGNLKNTKNFPVPSMIGLLDLKKELKEKSERYQAVFLEIMEQYDVKLSSAENNQQQVYTWADHKDVTEISKKVADLSNELVNLESVCFLANDDFFQIVEGMSINQIEFLGKFLRK